MKSSLGTLLLWLLTIVLLTIVSSADAQQAGRVPQIGFLAFGSPSSYVARVAAFRGGLRELGYIEGRNIQIDYRYAERDFNQIVADMIRRHVDVIVAGGTPPARAAKNATKTIPIVVAVAGDTVGAGLVASLAHPGRNVTGLTTVAPDLSGKRLEVIKDVLPKVSSVAILTKPSNASHPPQIQESELAGQALGVKLQILDVEKPDDFESAIEASRREGAEALIVLPEGLFTGHRRRLVDLTNKSKLATVFYDQEFVDAGGLMSYGVSYPDLFRRAAVYVHKILQGTKPADLPVEQPTKFEFVINLKTAKQIGLTIPPNVLARADKVIR